MRLIDADDIEFRKKFCKRFCTNLADITSCPRKNTCEIMKWIDEQPTAYDVDKVMERLEEMRDELLHSTDYNNDIINYCLDWFDMAIEIVKGAVKE